MTLLSSVQRYAHLSAGRQRQAIEQARHRTVAAAWPCRGHRARVAAG